MGWADRHVQELLAGRTVQFRPHGNSMKGRVESGQLVTVSPLDGDPAVGAIVLCRVRGSQYLHLVKSIRDDEFLIGNNRGGINGWTSRNAIYGIMTKVED